MSSRSSCVEAGAVCEALGGIFPVGAQLTFDGGASVSSSKKPDKCARGTRTLKAGRTCPWH
eukprot:6182090-Pleurochrysis_carterae.AAC.1